MPTIPIVIAAVYAGGLWWNAVVIIFGAIMAAEWCDTASGDRAIPRQAGLMWKPSGLAQLNACVMLLFLVGFVWRLTSDALSGTFFWGYLIVFATLLTLSGLTRKAAALWFGLGFIYVAIPCAAIMWLRSDPTVGLQQIGWIVALVIAADTGAYIAGRSIGGPKLAPRISPNKTWAGLGGAVASAAIVGSVTAALLGQPSPWPLAALSAGLAIIEQAGDLAESAFKRHFGVKDASNIIPGHGGALDRVDGLIAVAATVAAINLWLGSSVLTWL